MHWEPNPDAAVVEMRVFQISNTGENIAGYAAFPYSAQSGTFIILNGCKQIFGKAYTAAGRSSLASNALEIPCLCGDCGQPPYSIGFENPPPISDDGRISAISSQALTFSAEKNKFYKVECCTDLITGNWEFLTILSPEFKGDINYAIDTSAHDSCYYRVIPLN